MKGGVTGANITRALDLVEARKASSMERRQASKRSVMGCNKTEMESEGTK